MIKKLQLDLLMYIPIRFYTSFGIIKLISQISQISRDIHAYNIAPRDILKVRYLLHPTLERYSGQLPIQQSEEFGQIWEFGSPNNFGLM